MKSGIRLFFALAFFWAASGQSATREISEPWKVEVGQSRKQALKFFQAESVQLTGTYTQNGRPVDLSGTNTIVVWEINGWNDYTNTYAISTGMVNQAQAQSNTATFILSPEQSNLQPGTYLGFVRALQKQGDTLTQVAVLAYQTIAVEWSPDSRHYNIVTPLTYPPLYTEANWKTITNQVSELSGQVAAFDGRIDALEAETNTWNTAAGLAAGAVQTTEYAEYTEAVSNRLQTLEGQTN